MAEFVRDTDVDPRKSTLPFVIPILCTGLFSIFLTFCCIFCWVYYPIMKEKFVLFYEAVIGYHRLSFGLDREGQESLGQGAQGQESSLLLHRRKARGQHSSLGPQRRKVKGQYGSIRPQRRKGLGGSVHPLRLETQNGSLRPQRLESRGPVTTRLPQRLEPEGPVTTRLPQRLEPEGPVTTRLPERLEPDGPVTTRLPQRLEDKSKDSIAGPLRLEGQEDGCSLGISTPDQEASGRGALAEAAEKTCLLCKGEGPTYVRRMRNANITNSL